MKLKSYLLLGIAALAFAACNEDIFTGVRTLKYSFVVYSADAKLACGSLLSDSKHDQIRPDLQFTVDPAVL